MAELVKNLQNTGVNDAAISPEAAAPASAAEKIAAVGRRDDFDRDVWCVLGAPADALDVDHALGQIDAAIRERRKFSFVTPNVNWLVRALHAPEARRELLNADMSLIDGAPLAAIAKQLGVPIKGRVAGADLFEALRRRPGVGGRRVKVFFLGGRAGAAEAAAAAVNEEAGGVEAVGWLNPGYGDVESMSAQSVIDEINAAGADFIVVALGAAKGQTWIDRNRSRLDAPVIAHLGAVVDFTGGGIARAPALFQRLGLEWLWRIKEDPSLWRRYLRDGWALLIIVLTRLAPQLLRRAPSGAATPARAQTTERGGRRIITLSGDMTRPGLAGVRAAFRAAASADADIIVDLSGAARMDAAFLGLMLMLEKHVAGSGRTLFVDGANGKQLAFLRANAMEYPQSPPEEADLEARPAVA